MTTTSSERLEFASWAELQTHVMLLPYNESEGLGACHEHRVLQRILQQNSDGEVVVVKEIPTTMPFQQVLQRLREAPTPMLLEFVKDTHPVDNGDDIDDEDDILEHSPNNYNNGDNNNNGNNDKVEETVLSAAPTTADNNNNNNNSNNNNNNNNNTETTEEKKDDEPTASSTSWAPSLTAEWSAWTKRVVSEQVHKYKTAAAAQANASNSNNPNDDTQPCSIFFQNHTGAFLPAEKASITNTSLLIVRASAADSCPPECQFQWYAAAAQTTDESPLNWTELPAAQHAAFQPSAVLMGHYLKCRVVYSDADDADSTIFWCQTEKPVKATPTLFRGIRQTVQQKGYTTSVLVATTLNGAATTMEACRLFIGPQVVQFFDNNNNNNNSTNSPLVECRVHHVTATVPSYANAKELQLHLADGGTLPAHWQCSSTNSDDDDNNNKRNLTLQAPNRMGRESLLLALGITKHTQGSPLDESTPLFVERAASETSETSPPVSPVASVPPTTMSPPTSKPPLLQALPFTRSSSLDTRLDHSSSNYHQSTNNTIQQLKAKLSKQQSQANEWKQACNKAQSKQRQTEHKLTQSQATCAQLKTQVQQLQAQLADYQRNQKQLTQLEQQTTQQADQITEITKRNTALQNEKAVLTATIQARDQKLASLAELSDQLAAEKTRAAEATALQAQLDARHQDHQNLLAVLDQCRTQAQTAQTQLAERQAAWQAAHDDLQAARTTIEAHQSQQAATTMKLQKLKAERNSYKQKNESLTKEMAKICRHGRTLAQVEKMLADAAVYQQEVALLRQQKRQAVTDLEHYRTAYQETVQAQQQCLGQQQYNAVALVARQAELERLVSEMTEYIQAKELQLETAQHINRSLQSEIHQLAQAAMHKNDV